MLPVFPYCGWLMTFADLARGHSRPAVPKRVVAIVAAVALVLGGASAVRANAVADEQAHSDAVAAAKLEETLVVLRTAALDDLQPSEQVMVDDTLAWASSASPLLSPADVLALQSISTALNGSMGRSAPSGAASSDLASLYDQRLTMLRGARERFAVIISTTLAGSTAALAAAPIADAASRQAVLDSAAVLQASWDDLASVAAPLAGLTAAVTAVAASQAAAVAAQAAAAAAAAQAAAAAAAKSRGTAPRAGSSGAAGVPEPVCNGGVLACSNQLRAWAGVGALTSDASLNASAQQCAERMVSEGMVHSAYPGGTWGENIAMGYGSETAVFNGWKSSEGHRKNILRSAFTKMGLGHAGSYWCQQFG